MRFVAVPLLFRLSNVINVHTVSLNSILSVRMSTIAKNLSLSSSSSSLPNHRFDEKNGVDSETILPRTTTTTQTTSTQVKSSSKRTQNIKGNVIIDSVTGTNIITPSSTTVTLPSSIVSTSSSINAATEDTTITTHYVGYHASGAGGIWKALVSGHSIGAKALAFFTRSSRTWNCPPLQTVDIDKFKLLMKQYNYSPQVILPHGTYLSNLGAPPGTDLYHKSIEGVYDEALRCYQLGLLYYNFHPGSFKYCTSTTTTDGTTVRDPVDEGCYNVAQAINVLHQRIPRIIFVIENMAGQGSILGSRFEEIKTMIDHVHDKERVGVCIDTAHAHGSGYDMTNPRTYNHMMEEFDKIIGMKYLRGMHLNDSKVTLKSLKDRHENIGHGYIGIEGFRCIMNDQRTAHIPLILETPSDGNDKDELSIYRQEIALLYRLQGTKEGEPVSLTTITYPKKTTTTTTKTKKRKTASTSDEDDNEGGNITQDEEEIVKPSSSLSSSSATMATPVRVHVPKGKKGRKSKNIVQETNGNDKPE